MVVFQGPIKMTTLSTYIKNKIGRRICIGLVLLILGAIFITAYDLRTVFQIIKTDENKKCQDLALFIIGQKLVGNAKAISIKISSMNRKKDRYTYIENINKEHEQISWKWPFSWQYIYPINNIDGRKFGYIDVVGSFFDRKQLMLIIYERIILVFGFLMFIFYLFYPLSRKIPEEVFIKPTRALLDLLKNERKNLVLDANQPEEIYQIQREIIQLMEQLKKTTKEATLLQLSAKVAHDIRSPLSVLDMTIIDIKMHVPEFEYSLLTEAIQSIRDTSNNLFVRYRENIEQSDDSDELIIDDGNSESLLSLQDIIQTVVTQKRQEWRDLPCNLIVKIEENTQCYHIKAIPNEVKRVLSNILNNAYEAIQHRREIFIELTCEENKEILNLTIRDFGSGIPKDKINAVLSGISLKHKGNGIGLSSAVKYMKMLHGNLEITSEIKEGTCVKLYFPIFV